MSYGEEKESNPHDNGVGSSPSFSEEGGNVSGPEYIATDLRLKA